MNRFTLCAAVLLFGAMQTWGATPILVLSDSDGISGFDLYGKGALWWSRPGVCTGEFIHEATVRVRAANINYGTVSLAKDCNIMETEQDNAVRDSAYTYFFSDGQLFRKALSSSETSPAALFPTPPYSPTLPAGQNGTVLEIADGRLWFARYHPSGDFVDLFSIKTDGSENAQYVTTLAGTVAPVKKIRWFRYKPDNEPLVDALAVLLANGRLYRHRVGGTSALLATGVSDFAVHRTSYFLPPSVSVDFTSIFAAKGVSGSLSPSTPAGSVLRIDADSGTATTIYTAPGQNQVLSVATDSDQFRLFDPKNIYITEGSVACGGLFCTISDWVVRRNQLPGTDGTWDLIVSTGAGENLRSDDDWVYFINNNSIKKIATDAPPIEFDITALGLEVGQTVQTMSADINQLVAYKGPTYVRGYAYLRTNTTGQSTFLPSALLRVWVNGEEVPDSPFSPVNNTSLDGTSDMNVLRPALNRSFLFEIPRPDLPPGDLTMTLTVNPNGTRVETGNNPYADNDMSLPGPVTLVDTVLPCLQVYAMPTGMGTYSPKGPAFVSIIRRARSLLPARNLWVSKESWDWDGDVFFTQPFGGVNSNDTQDDDALGEIKHISEHTSWLLGCEVDHFVGMIHPAVANFGGLGYTPGNCLIASMSGGTNFSSPDVPGGGRTMAHEMAHNYGRKHVNCGGPKNTDPNYPFSPCTIGSGNALSWWGFDSLSQTVINPSTTGDLLSYAGNRWPSSYTWNAVYGTYLAAKALGPNPIAAKGPLSVEGGEVLFVEGIIRFDLNSAEFKRFVVLPAEGIDPLNLADDLAASEAAADSPQAYFIHLLAPDGTLLASNAIPLDVTGDFDGVRQNFAHWVPFVAGTRRIQMVWEGMVLAERVVSPHAPTLQLGQPVIDSVAETASLNWTASDADGDSLLGSVHYSTDNGVNWHILRDHYAGTSVVLDTRNLPGSTQARLRVWVSDGVNTTFAMTEPFIIPKKAPTPIFDGVGDGERVPFGRSFRFDGLALDPEDLSGLVQLSWDLNGPVTGAESGDAFAPGVLPPGAYEITLTAQDTDDQVAFSAREFEVGPLVIPEGPEPRLDGFCNDPAYADGAFLRIPLEGGGYVPVRLVHANSNLFVSFSDLQLPLRGTRIIGLRVDVDDSRSPSAGPGDVGFFVNDVGIPFQEAGVGGSMVVADAPPLGFTAVVERGDNAWSAEFRIADNLVGGWNHAAGVMIDHGTVQWPPNATANEPVSWAAAWFGPNPPGLANRLPVANAGPDRVVNLTGPRLIVLDGTASYDPDGDPLTFNWVQVGGPSVTVSNLNPQSVGFRVESVAERTELTFRLMVNDGSQDSLPDETHITLIPTPTLAQAPRSSAVLQDGALYIKFQGEPGRTFFIEATQDFSEWSRIYTNTADFFGVIDFIEQDVSLYSERFYRAVSDSP